MNQGEDFENWRYDVALEAGEAMLEAMLEAIEATVEATVEAGDGLANPGYPRWI